MPKAKRKQLNIGITPDQYEAVRIAAEEDWADDYGLLPGGHPGEGSPGAGAARRGHAARLGDSLPAIPHQGQDTARYANRVAECLAGLLCRPIVVRTTSLTSSGHNRGVNRVSYGVGKPPT